MKAGRCFTGHRSTISRGVSFQSRRPYSVFTYSAVSFNWYRYSVAL